MRKPRFFLPAAVLVLLLCTGGSCLAVDGQVKIAQTAGTVFPIVIAKPGSYVLTTNLQVSNPKRHGILIKTNDVTLDLNGHTIQGPQSGTGIGIRARNRYTVTIRNGKVWGFGWGGISIENDAGHPGGGHIIEGVQCPNNGSTGITISDGIVSNCTANNNGNVGITPTDSTVMNCTVINNASSGIYAVRSTISNCTIHNNGSDGVTAFESTITDCSLQGNRDEGIAVWTNNVVKGCNARANGHYGFNIAKDGQNHLYRNVASGNTSGQFFCPGGNSCVDNVSW